MDLSTQYLGLKLDHPIIASASPLTSTVDGIRALEAAGAAAVVMPSLFEEQVRDEDRAYAMYTDHGSYSHAEAGSYFPEIPDYDRGISGHLDTVRRAVAMVNIPVIASLNAVTIEGWTSYASRLEQAGAFALELNMYAIPADPSVSAAEVEARWVEVVRAVKRTVTIPVAVKLPLFLTATGHVAHQLVGAGADGLVLFNRFYQPDVDLGSLAVKANLKLSSSHEAGPPLLWIALLSGRLDASLAATSGVETAEQVIKYLLAGADVVMTASALLRHGPAYLKTLVTELTEWIAADGRSTVSAIRGLKSVKRDTDDTAELLRAQYIQHLAGYVPKQLVA